MAILIRPPKRIKKARSQNSREVLRRLEEYLKNYEKPVRILCEFWKDQQDAITYQELRKVVKDGAISQETIQLWEQDYSVLVANKLGSMWQDAIKAGSSGQPIMDEIDFEFHVQSSDVSKAFQFNAQATGVLDWINERGAEFVTSSTEEQRKAISSLLEKKIVESHTTDELAKLIKPCIGLTEGQAKANAKYYDNIVATLKKEHPRMKEGSIQRRARDAAGKYAERQLRQRAMTIAQTEMAFAYNRGADFAVRQAQAQGLMGEAVKRWCTSGDDGVCSACEGLEGMELGMDEKFPFRGKILFSGQELLPPLHPRCACGVEYVEISSPTHEDIPEMGVSIAQEDSFRVYTTEEIEDMARQTDDVASKHIAVPSKWSGKIVVDDELGKRGKLWDCDILMTHLTAPHMILHEQIHARSVSYYDAETYSQYEHIEEASVQFIAQEISMIAGIEIIESNYDERVDALRILGRRIGIYSSDYDFSKAIIEMPLPKRLDWISETLYATMSTDPTVTVEEYQALSELLDKLY